MDASIRLPAKTQECLHGWRLAGVGTEISIEVSDLRDAMRRAYENRQLTRDMGIRAAQHAHENYPWREISRRMAARLQLVGTSEDTTQATAKVVAAAPTLTACILHDNQQLSDLIETLGSVRHWCREIIITTTHVTDDLTAIAQEYRARLYPALPIDLREHRLNSVLRRSTSDWVLWLDAGESVSLTAASEIKVRLPQLNPRVWGVALSIETLSLGQIDREVRILRNVNECLLGSDGARSPYRAVVDHAKQVIDLDAPITTSTIVPVEPFKLNRELLSDGLSIWQCERLAAALVRQGDHFHAECLFRQVFEAPSVPPDLLIRVTSELMKTSINIGDPYRAEEYRQFGHSNWPTSAQFNHLPQPRLYEVGTDELKLYLGAGSKTLPGYLTVDLVPGPTVDIALDLDRCPWPWSDSSVSRIVAEDLVEHLGINLIQFCSEAWRVLRPGGLLYVRTPHCEGESSWIDPTHRWHYDTRSFEFLDPTTSWGKHHPHYTTKKWKLLTSGVRGPQNIHACLTPIK